MSENFEKNQIKTQEAGVEAEKRVSITNFKDPLGVSLKKLVIGLWYIEHKKVFRNIIIVALISIGVSSWFYSIYHFTVYIFKGMYEDKRLIADISQTAMIDHNQVLKNLPKELKIYGADILNGNEERYDFAVKIENPNARHLAEFTYHFEVAGKKIGSQTGFIFPGESKYFMVLGQEMPSAPSAAKFVTDDFSWIKIDAHKIYDWDKFYKEHLDLKISDKEFLPATVSGLSEKVRLNSVKFKVVNETAYNYKGLNFLIVLFNGNEVAGVNKFAMEELLSGQEREVKINWPGRITRVTEIEILPEIDILDKNIYLKYEGEARF